MYDNYKGVYLPLTVHINLCNKYMHSINEWYFRMSRLPINMYKRKFRPAFDDIISFNDI
jgi:hypothetical protein